MTQPVAADALTDRPGGAILFDLPGRRVSAGAFAADALRLAAALPDAGHVVNLCTGRYAFAVGFAAALLRGQVSVMSSDRSPDRLRSLQASFPGLAAVTDGKADLPLPVTAVQPPGGETAPIPAIPSDRVAAIVFTSGSTGEPLAHVKRWGALAARSRAGGAAFGLETASPAALVGTVPPQHMYGFETTILLPLHAACATWCGPAFYPADIRAALDAVAAPRILVTTPVSLRALLAHQTALPALRRIISATAPLDPAVASLAEQRWDTVVSEIFGATEVGSIASRRTTDGPAWTPYQGIHLAEAQTGLLVQAPGCTDTLLDDAVALHPDGRFTLLGRRTDVVKLAGHRASLAGLNRALEAVEGVAEGVFLPPDEGAHGPGARMTAFVVAPSADADTILAALRSRIDPLFLPRRIVHLDRLPRNELGKLPLRSLRALLAGQ